jgi:hypothetical protein
MSRALETFDLSCSLVRWNMQFGIMYHVKINLEFYNKARLALKYEAVTSRSDSAPLNAPYVIYPSAQRHGAVTGPYRPVVKASNKTDLI